jgi:hypothetical protein
MKASRFSDAQKAFILKQGADGIALVSIRTTLGANGISCVDKQPANANAANAVTTAEVINLTIATLPSPRVSPLIIAAWRCSQPGIVSGPVVSRQHKIRRSTCIKPDGNRWRAIGLHF